MPDQLPNDEHVRGWIWQAGVAVAGGFTAALGWVVNRLDKKVSKEVFQVYKDANDTAHGVTHSALKEIKDAQIEQRQVFRDVSMKLFDKMDGKKDKE